jgi:adenylylsulfate kinase-like enzyme
MSDSGGVIWITGLPASGKTTIARQVVSNMRSAGRFALLLDGDEFRGVVDDECFSKHRSTSVRLAIRRDSMLARLPGSFATWPGSTLPSNCPRRHILR